MKLLSHCTAIPRIAGLSLREDTGPAAAILEILNAAIDSVLGEIEEVEVGCLVSLVIEVPACALPETAVQGSEVCWYAQDIVLHGQGLAIRFESDAASNFEKAAARWRVFGFSNKSSGIPRAFFTLPSAPATATPTLWVPRILMHWFKGSLMIALTATRDNSCAFRIEREWLSEVEAMLAPPSYQQAPGRIILSVRAAPDGQQWISKAEAAIEAIASRLFDKVVLARRLELRLSRPPALNELVRKLARDHPASRVFMLPHGNGRTMAASPEMIAVKRGRNIVCDALAGTAKRTGVASEDAKTVAAMMASMKERHEHAIVVDDIRSSLAPICENVAHASEPSVLQLNSLLHLQTKIHGRLRPGVGLLRALQRIHPTAAVLGFPRDAAAEWLEAAEEKRDGLYSGAVGWLDLNGDGEAAVVLRSAYIEDRTAVLWAGAGIVAQSEPSAELAETSLKFATMLEALCAA